MRVDFKDRKTGKRIIGVEGLIEEATVFIPSFSNREKEIEVEGKKYSISSVCRSISSDDKEIEIDVLVLLDQLDDTNL